MDVTPNALTVAMRETCMLLCHTIFCKILKQGAGRVLTYLHAHDIWCHKEEFDAAVHGEQVGQRPDCSAIGQVSHKAYPKIV